MPDRKTRRTAPSVNAGSMADIAFLLLIFFLVTATILEDEGVLVRLPVWVEDIAPPPINEDQVLTVLVNKTNELLIEGEEATLKDIPQLVRKHLTNPEFKANEKLVSLTHDRGTDYETYLQVYDALLASYHILRDEKANELYTSPFDELNKTRQKEIKQLIPLIISEAEPTEVE